MASPYVYNMGGSSSPYQSSTPFIPPANLLGNTSPYSSPYTGPNPLPGGSPHSPNIPLPGAPNTPLYGYDDYLGWGRPRRGSFHGGQNPYDAPAWLSAPPMGGHHRSRSFGEHGYPPSPYQAYQWPQPQPPSPFAGYRPPSSFHIHPYLNGEYSRGDFAFDLSAPKFAPMKCTGPGHWEFIPPEELAQPATWPHINQLRIVCDAIPQWPIDFTPDPSYFGGSLPPPGTQLPAITLGDVLIKIYNHFGQRITHMDWASLSPEQETAISRAYTVRCKALGSAEAVERSQGVKRIDYAGGHVWFKGLTRVGDGMEVLKLRLAKK